MAQKIHLDETDFKLIYYLEQDCRLSLRELGEKVGISKRMTDYRIRRLESNQVILGYSVILDNSLLGYVNHDVWIQLKSSSEKRRDEFIDALVKNPSVNWVSSCGGKFDVGISILSPNVSTFSETFDNILDLYSDIILNYFVTITNKFQFYSRTYFLQKAEKFRSVKSYFSPKSAPISIDSNEKKILQVLSNNSKATAIEIGKIVGLSPNTVRLKIVSLESKGVIQGYRAIVAPSSLGFRTYEILANLTHLSESKRKSLEEYCLQNPHVAYLLNIVGPWNIDLSIDARDSDHFQQILNEFRSNFGTYLRDYEFIPIMRVHKSNYSPLLR